MRIFKALRDLWYGSIESMNPNISIPQNSGDSPVKVEMINEKPNTIIAKLSLEPGGYNNLITNLSSVHANEEQNVITIIIKSRTSKNTCYNVIFNNINGAINIKCDCPAGEFTKLCWHKLALVRGDSSMLADFCDLDDFHRVQKWIKQSTFPKLIADHDKNEKIFLEAQRIFKILKETIEDAMRTGA